MTTIMRRFSDLKMKSKILTGVSIPLTFLIILGIVSYLSVDKITYTNKWVNHTHEVLAESDSIVAAAVDMETGMRGYLLAGKEEFLDPYNSGEAKVYKAISDLQQTVSDNPPQVKRLGEIKTILKNWQSNVTEMQIGLRRDINKIKTMDHMADLIGEALGKKYFDAFREQIALFKSREETLLKKRSTQFNQSLNSGTASDASINENMKWVNHTYKVLAEADAILAAAVDMETGMRGFLLAGKEEFLEPYNAGKARLYSIISQLKQTVSDNPPQVKLLSDIEQNMKEWEANVTEMQIGLRRDINKVKTMDNVADLVGRALGKTYFDKFRAQMALFSEREEILLDKRDKEFVQAMRNGTASEQEIQNTLKWVNHTHNVLAEARGILAAAVDMETGMRGFLLAGKEEFLEPYNSGKSLLFSSIAQLKETVNDNPSQVKLLSEIEQNLQEWTSNVTEVQIAMRRDVNKTKKMFHMADLVAEARGKTYFDNFRGLIADFQNEERQLIEIRQEENAATVATTYTTIILCCVVSLLLGVGLAFFIGKNIAAPIGHMTGNMSRLAEGDTSVEIGGIERKDEVGKMARALEVFKQNRIEADLREKQQKEEQAEKISRAEKVDSLIKEFENKASQAVSTVASAATQLTQTAQQVTGLMDKANDSAQSGASGASQTTANVQSVASAAEEMSSTVKEIASQVNSSNSLVLESVEKVEAADVNAKELAKSSERVREVVGLISDISNQINLLALNATIESARAGEAGKGFAVVASEVKNLASQTDKSIDEVGKVVGEMSSASDGIISILDEIKQSVNSISESSTSVASSVEEQSATTNEIASSMQSAAKGVQMITDNIQEISDSASHSKASSDEVLKASQDLSKQAEHLDKEIKDFLSDIRAA